MGDGAVASWFKQQTPPHILQELPRDAVGPQGILVVALGGHNPTSFGV